MKHHSALIAVCLLAIGSVALAQAPAANSAKLQKLEAMMKELNLTPDQKTKLLPIFREEMPKIEAIKSNTSLTGRQKLQQLRAVHEQTDTQVKPILSADQYAKLQQIRQQQIEEAIQKKRATQSQ